jgi:SAM-dependent methyltransferase
MTSTSIADHFNLLGAQYDTEVSWRQDEALLSPFAALCGSLAEPILEIGCGTGIVGSVAKGERTAIGIDLSEELLRHAALRGLHGVVSDARALPFPDESIGTILVRQVFQYVDPLSIAPELRRVVRHRGSLFAQHFVLDRLNDLPWWLVVKRHTQPHRQFLFTSRQIDTALEKGGWAKVRSVQQTHRRHLCLDNGYFTASALFSDPVRLLEWMRETAPEQVPDNEVVCRPESLEFEYTQTWIFSEYRLGGEGS